MSCLLISNIKFHLEIWSAMSGRICYSFNNSLGSSLWWLFYFLFPTFLSSFLLLISFFLIGYDLFFNFEVAPLSYFKLCNWLTGFFIIVRWEISTIRDIYLPFLLSIYLLIYLYTFCHLIIFSLINFAHSIV